MDRRYVSLEGEASRNMEKDQREALLYEKLSGARVRCNVCQWRCTILPGKYGLCKMRKNTEGVLHLLNYAEVSSMGDDPIEKKPLYHFFPGSRCFSLGGWGCNFHCRHCQNWQISCVDGVGGGIRGSQRVGPEEAINLTKRHNCTGISWTYNEPTMWFEYTLDSAKLAKEAGLYTVYVTNGYMTPEALDAIGPVLDAWRVDVKGFSDSVYSELAKVQKWRGILDVAKRAKEKWGMHVEVVTNIIHGLNDDEQQLRNLAKWICGELGELTPWHVTRSYPQYDMMDMRPTPVATLERAYSIGKEAGLRFVYLGNVPGHEKENTTCYSCGKTMIERWGYQTKVVGVDGSRCKFCGADLNIVTAKSLPRKTQPG
jgi:pyruvate formate lyase activating enzyme